MVRLAVVYEDSGDAVVVHIGGEVDVVVDDEFSSHLERGLAAASSKPGRVLIVDLHGVDFIGSGGLRALLECHDDGVTAGIAVRLVATKPMVLRPMEITRLDKVFAVYPTVSEALLATRGPQVAS